MGIQDCVYEQVKKRGIGKTLRMGEACACCRSARTHMEILNDVLTFCSPLHPATPNRVKKKVSGRSSSPSPAHQISSTFKYEIEMRR